MKINKRRGFSLVEVVAVLAVSSLIAGMAVWLVHASMQKSRDGQRHLATQNTITRLAETFRRDAHAAANNATAIAEVTVDQKDAAASATSSVWLINLADGRVVRYHLEPGRLIRSEFAATAPGKNDPTKDSSKAINQDSFELPSGEIFSIQLEPSSQPRIATLLISPAQTDSDSPSAAARPQKHPLRIDAAVSIDTRFDNVTTQDNKKANISKETKK